MKNDQAHISTFSILPDQGKITCSAPSNIALVKYWGKKPIQIPQNASISFTLNVCKTITSLSYKKLNIPSDDFDFDLKFEGKPKPEFAPKIKKFFERIQSESLVNNFVYEIDTQNTFPHSSGIASSASSMAALSFCIAQMEKSPEGVSEADLVKKASHYARLGSGSAARSIEGPVTVWGKHQGIEGSNDNYAIKFPHSLHVNFKRYQDTILLIDKGEKQVSSSVGHDLMHGHPFSSQRFEQASKNIVRLKDILISGDLEAFIEVVESEALTLHAMMMTSLPYFILMKPNTLSVINKIWQYRKDTGSSVCFTLDAGANVHVLYPETEKETVLEFINNELVAYCQNGQYICDTVGEGAKVLDHIKQ